MRGGEECTLAAAVVVGGGGGLRRTRGRGFGGMSASVFSLVVSVVGWGGEEGEEGWTALLFFTGLCFTA